MAVRSLLRDGIDPDQALAMARRQADLRQRTATECRGAHEQLHRYTLVAEGAAAELRVSGVFRAGDYGRVSRSDQGLFPGDGTCVSRTRSCSGWRRPGKISIEEGRECRVVMSRPAQRRRMHNESGESNGVGQDIEASMLSCGE